ncbi:MAG: hypothetical protein IJ717_11815 [Treponema sp.]|nr:hypothetical protein [Treponema sp.]
MTKILCNNNGRQMIFNTFGECARHFKVSVQKVRYAIDNDKFLREHNINISKYYDFRMV